MANYRILALAVLTLLEASSLRCLAQEPPVAPEREPQAAALQGGTQSTTLKSGTESTTLQGGTQSTTLRSGTQSTTLQSSMQSTTLQTGTQASMVHGGVQEEAGPVNILFLVDASYSMKEKLGGDNQKIDEAKQVLQEALRRIPGGINLGLRVFGQGFTGVPDIDCRQTALMVPLGQDNRRSIIDHVRQIQPFGLTPLEYALRQAAEDDFNGIEGRKVIILITDGADTCLGDPCRFIAQLPLYGIKLKVDVVGLNLKREDRDQLHCIADHSGGKYYDANTASQLIESVSHSVDTAISGKVIMHSQGKNGEKPEPLPLNP